MQKQKLIKIFEPITDKEKAETIKEWLREEQERERFYEDGEGRLYRIRGKFFNRTIGIFSKAEVIVCENGTLKAHEIPTPKEPVTLVNLRRLEATIAGGD